MHSSSLPALHGPKAKASGCLLALMWSSFDLRWLYTAAPQAGTVTALSQGPSPSAA